MFKVQAKPHQMWSVGLAFSRFPIPATVGVANTLDAVLVSGAAHVCPDLFNKELCTVCKFAYFNTFINDKFTKTLFTCLTRLSDET